MKKIILIVVLIFSFQNNLFASESSNQNQFNQWLLENGHSQYLKDGGAKVDICATFKKNSDAWLNEECGNYPKGKMITMNNLKIKLANKALSATNITYHANPNLDTLIYYLWKYSYRDRSSHLKEFKPTNSSYDFKFNLIEDEFLKKQMKTKGILSYLYYQDGEVLIDELSPKERLGEFLNNETKFYSMSWGKSVTAYLLGHAICDGYIDGVDARVNDWPVIKDSLYHDQKLINFLNMNTGDQKSIDELNGGGHK